MSRVAQNQAGSLAHRSRDRCTADVREAFRIIEASGGFEDRPPTLRGATPSADGDSVVAAVESVNGRRTHVPLRRYDDTLYLDSFFGTPPQQARDVSTNAHTTPHLPPGAQAVAISDTSGPCLPLAQNLPSVAGGCELKVHTPQIRVTIGTVFGRFKFGACSLQYRVHANRRGDTWTDGVLFDSPVNRGCADVKPCSDGSGRPLPWKGRIYFDAGGVLTHQTTVCLDTCVGFYAGETRTYLWRRWRRVARWRMTADDASVGRSGLMLDGKLAIESDTLTVKVAGS